MADFSDVKQFFGIGNQSSYNHQEMAEIDKRFRDNEEAIGLSGGLPTALQGRVASLENGQIDAASNLEVSDTDASAISVSVLKTEIESAGSETRTLAAPASDGKFKLIEMTVDMGDVVVAGTNVLGSEAQSFTFDDVGDSLLLFSLAGKWIRLGGIASA